MKFVSLTLATAIIFFLCGANTNTQDVPKITTPVPVVQQPKEDSKSKELKEVVKSKDDPPVVSEEGAVLPLGFVKNKLDVMPSGTKTYVSVEAVKCDSKRRVYLDPDQVYGTQNEGRVVLVSKDSVGYHIVLEKVDHQWTCQELPPGVKWIPVKTITSR